MEPSPVNSARPGVGVVRRRAAVLLLALSIVGAAVAGLVGPSWTERLSSHSGFYQVTGADPLDKDGVPRPKRPRRTVVVVVDGLGYIEAQGMRSAGRLAASGQCRKTYVGSLSVSRPVYAVLSTGLEQDRTGVRNNDDDAALTAESIWELARKAGLRVSAISELTWWQEMFPKGFSAYVTRPRTENYFQQAAPADLMLIHPLNVDEMGHEWGARSPRYAEAVARVDRELEGFLATVDLNQDLVILTADHGHSLLGGHGGQQDRIAHTLTCFAGVGIRRDERPGTLLSTNIGPAVSLLMGLPFPAQMRAGDGDGLDVLWEIADPGALPAAYLAERKQTVESFRASSRAQLLRWQPACGGKWSAFYASFHRQHERAAVLWLSTALLVIAFLLWSHARTNVSGVRKYLSASALFATVWIAIIYTAVYAFQVLLRSSFDLSSIPHRSGFLQFSTLLSVLCVLGGLLLHMVLRRSLHALLIDMSALLGITLIVYLGIQLAMGWSHLFPVPGPMGYFFPYFGTLFLACACVTGFLIAAFTWVILMLKQRAIDRAETDRRAATDRAEQT